MLAKHARDAFNSVALNLAGATAPAATGSRHYNFALGSLREVSAALDTAAAHGWLADPPSRASATGSAA